MEKQSTNALVRVRQVFVDEKKPLILSAIREKTGLKSAEVSMALCHLRKHRYVTREKIPNVTGGQVRKTVWSYEYHPERIESVAD